MPRDVDPAPGEPRDDDLRALDEARAALYRPDADDEARRVYADLLERVGIGPAVAQATPVVRTAERRRGARRIVIAVTAVAVTAVAVLLGGVLLAPRSAAVRMTPLRIVGATDPTAEEAGVLSLFAGSFAAQNKLALRTAVDAPPALAAGGVQRSSVREITGTGTITAPSPTASGTVTIVVLCTTTTAFRWTLTATEGGRTRVLATSSAATCLGTASYATVSVADERRASLRFVAPRARSALVALVVVPDRP